MKKKAVIIGASKKGLIAYHAYNDQYDIVKFLDNNPNLYEKKIQGIDIQAVNKIVNIEYDVIIIASQYYDEIKIQLKNLNVKDNILVFDYSLEGKGDYLNWNEDNTEIYKYIQGELFSGGISINFDGTAVFKERETVIEDLIENRKVIHLGCCDHLCVIEEKIRTNKWLHAKISNKAEKCIGIDINDEAVKLSSRYSDNIICGNILEEINEISIEQWDDLLIPDVLEHISNPVEFLSKIKENYKNTIERIIVSVPNAFSKYQFIRLNNNIECINSDNRYQFTPYTIAKVLNDAGYRIDKLIMCGTVEKVTKDINMPNIVVIAKM